MTLDVSSIILIEEDVTKFSTKDNKLLESTNFVQFALSKVFRASTLIMLYNSEAYMKTPERRRTIVTKSYHDDKTPIPNTVRDYLIKLRDEELKYLQNRLEQNLSNDLGEALLMIQKNEPSDLWLKSAESFEQFYKMIDTLKYYVAHEYKRRGLDKQEI